jgi:PAS domain S-box-containing protein
MSLFSKQNNGSPEKTEFDCQSFFDDWSDGLLISDPEAKYFSLGNRAICKMLGYTKEEIKKLGVKDIHPAAELPLVLNRFKDLAENKIKVAASLPVKRKDGSIFYADISASSVTIAGKKYPMGHFRDITERKKTEDELVLKNTLLDAQLNTSLEGILAVNEQGGIILYNNRFIEMWDISKEIIKSKSDERALQAVLGKLQDAEEFLSRVKYLYEHQAEKSREEVGLKDGRIFDRYSAPMFSSSGVYYGRIWFFRDVTGQKEKEKELKTYVDELSRTNKLMIGRELRMAELKQEIERLKIKNSKNENKS